MFIGLKDLNEQALNKSNQKQQKTNELVGLNFKETMKSEYAICIYYKKQYEKATLRLKINVYL